MALMICTECGKQFSDKAISCPNCGCPNDRGKFVQEVKKNIEEVSIQDDFTTAQVVEHLRYAAKLETTVFTFKQLYNRIEQKIRSLGHKSDISRPPAVFYDFPVWPTFFISFFVLLVLACSILNGNPFDAILIMTIIPLFFDGAYLLVDLGVAFGGAVAITAIGGIIHVILRNSEHKKVVDAYLLEVKKDENRVNREKEQIAILRKQQHDISLKIQENEALLTKLYNLNIIFPKYRHMVATITMLEYFESGRCSKLKGGHGAYDTYSYEEKQNIIIGKLDQVITMLNDIRKTQYLLYEAIQEANSNINRIYAQSEQIISSNNKIVENTALTAYNTKIIRQNTTISAYIDIFK